MIGFFYYQVTYNVFKLYFEEQNSNPELELRTDFIKKKKPV